MKKALIALMLLFTICLGGCAEKITLDNIDKVQTSSKYSKIGFGGKAKEIEENLVIKQAKDFANTFLSARHTKSYKKESTVENETIMFSDEYKSANDKELIEKINYSNEVYNKYKITTTLKDIDFKKIVILGDDAFINAVATVRLDECDNKEVAKALGFVDGINTNINCEYNLKLIYKDMEYFIYNFRMIEKDGNLKEIYSYKEKLESIELGTSDNKKDKVTDAEKEEINKFIVDLSKAQNDRNYKTMEGNEDYKYLSSHYKEMLNANGNDVKKTVELYKKFQVVTKYVGSNVSKIIKNKNSYTVYATAKAQLTNFISDAEAKKRGYPGGIGSVSLYDAKYTLIREDGELKVYDVETK